MNKKVAGSAVLTLQIAVLWMILGGTFCYRPDTYEKRAATPVGCGNGLPTLLPVLLLCVLHACLLRRNLRKESAKIRRADGNFKMHVGGYVFF